MISFPLYLWHWPLLSYAHILYGAIPHYLIRTTLVLTSILLAFLTYIWVEIPSRKYRNKYTELILISLLGVVGIFGIFTFSVKGISSYSPPVIYEKAYAGDFSDNAFHEKLKIYSKTCEKDSFL